MFTEHKRVPLRRDEIAKKALASNTRAFNGAFAMAQEHPAQYIRHEARRRAALASGARQGHRRTSHAKPGRPRRGAPGHRRQEEVRRRQFQDVHPALALHTERAHHRGGGARARGDHGGKAADAPSDEDEDDEIGSGATAYGRRLISWSSADHVGALGALYVVLALIPVSGRVMGDHDLRATLKRLRLPATGTTGFSATSTHRTRSLDAYLTLLMRHGFLDRQQGGGDGAGGNKKGGGAKGKRTWVQAQDDDVGGQQTYEWRWGARTRRARSGRRRWRGQWQSLWYRTRGWGMAMDERGGGSGAGRARANEEKADAANKWERMTKGIERAAGGQLAEVVPHSSVSWSTFLFILYSSGTSTSGTLY
ncbi:hypothetical protein B0H19DRAFT_437041 [Mycena capillaripes]|nr:hypothetical protein B0H19DRAFT_437041 [Mycena capillaripes]